MEYSTLAGDQSAHGFANAEAIEHYLSAIQAASKLPITAAGAVADLHAKCAAVLSVVGRHPEALDEYANALNCARSARDRQRECRFLLGLSWAQFNAHQIETMLKTCQESAALAQELGEVAIQASIAIAQAQAKAVSEGTAADIILQAEEAARLAESLKEPRLLAQTRTVLGTILQWNGDFARSKDHLHKGLEVARAAHAGFFFGMSLFQLGHVSLSLGEYEQALGYYRQLNEYAQAAGEAFWLARAPNCLGSISLELYDFNRALEFELEGDEAARRYSAWPEPRAHALLKAGLIHFEHTDYGRAEEFFLRAWELLDVDLSGRYRWHIPLLNGRGALALSRGDSDSALRFASESLELARKTHARKHEGRSGLSLGRRPAALHKSKTTLAAIVLVGFV
jgi:tetratricopeptide (TPR) repeat protein